jgi:hypothetical protein
MRAKSTIANTVNAKMPPSSNAVSHVTVGEDPEIAKTALAMTLTQPFGNG